MRLAITLFLLTFSLFVFVESKTLSVARSTRQRDLTRTARQDVVMNRLLRSSGPGRSKRQTDCVTQCGTYFVDQKFIACSNDIQELLTNAGSTIDVNDYCDGRGLNCPSLLKMALSCVGKYCTGGGDDDLSNVLKITNQSCYHAFNDINKSYCLDIWIGLESMIRSDTRSINDNYKACAEEENCASRECTDLLNYLDENVGCCFYGFSDTMSLLAAEGEDLYLSLDFIKSCGKRSLVTPCTV